MGRLLTFPSFQILWQSYPKNKRVAGGYETQKPCDEGRLDRQQNVFIYTYENQCAIRLSAAFIKAGMSLDTYTDPKCRHGYARGAESLANWIWRHYGRPKIFDWNDPSAKTSFYDEYYGRKTGIIFFKDFYPMGRQITPNTFTGDHIDLLTTEEGDLRTGSGDYSAQPTLKAIWFWEVN